MTVDGEVMKMPLGLDGLTIYVCITGEWEVVLGMVWRYA